MDKIERCEVYTQAIENWGNIAQINVAIEEMSELTKCLCKEIRGKHDYQSLVDEIADVTIMIEQLNFMFCCVDDVNERIDFKIKGLLNRINEEI